MIEVKDWRTMTEEEKQKWLENANPEELPFHYYSSYIMKDLDNAMKGKEMEITKVKYKCRCGAVMEMSKESLELLNEGQAYLILRCPWCGYVAKNYTANPEENELIKRLEKHIKEHEWRYDGVLVIFTDALKHILEEAKERQ